MCPNRSIIGDAILPQSATKLTKKCGSEFGGLLWRHLTPQKKTAILAHHNCSPSGAQQPQRYLVKFTSCMTFGAHKLVRSDNCCQRYIAICGKKIYRCTSTFSALNYCGGIFLKSLSCLYEVWRTKVSADFWTFRNF